MEVSGIDLWQWRENAIDVATSEHIPISEIDWLLREVADLDRLNLRLGNLRTHPKLQMQVSLAELSYLWKERVKSRIPVQYLLKTSYWRHFRLTVSPSVLIPRPETECLIDLAIALKPDFDGDWVDLGTGSGAIALGLAEAFPQATIHAVDLSSEALEIARQNAVNTGLNDRIKFYLGNWWEPLTGQIHSCVGMLSNPPYIPSNIVPELQPEVAWHEPHLALDGGEDGLDCVRYLIEGAPHYLRSRGLWLVELMAGQAPTVAELLKRSGAYDCIDIHSDLAGIERFVSALRR